jgi:hypothetical protein
MESIYKSCSNIYEVEKIINCKFYKNKKFYLIKWLYFPINESTWEPKSNLKNLKNLIYEFESEYPFSIDHDMYNIFCEEINKKKRYKNKNKNKKNLLESQKENEYLGKKRKIEYFSDTELKDDYFDKLKTHLYINAEKKQSKSKNIPKINLIIDLSSSNNKKEEKISNNSSEEPNSLNSEQEKINLSKLIIPKII